MDIFGKKVEVILRDAHDALFDDCWGCCNDNKIYVRDNLSRADTTHTILHEVFHFLFSEKPHETLDNEALIIGRFLTDNGIYIEE